MTRDWITFNRITPDSGLDKSKAEVSAHYAENLANDLERLCYAETEGKFFDTVTDNIDTIIKALRAYKP